MSKVLVSLLLLCCVALANTNTIKYSSVTVAAGKTEEIKPSACMCSLDHCAFTAEYTSLDKIVVSSSNGSSDFALYVDGEKVDATSAKIEYDLSSKKSLPKFKIENKGKESLSFDPEVLVVTGSEFSQKCTCTDCSSATRAFSAFVAVILAMMLVILV